MSTLEWNRRARVDRCSAGSTRTWTGSDESEEYFYSVSELRSEYGLPTIFLATLHWQRFDPIWKKYVWSVRILSRHRKRSAAMRACQKHARQKEAVR